MTAASSDPSHDSGATATTAASGSEQASSTSAPSHDNDSNGLAIAALVVGGLAIVLSVVALVRRPRRRPATWTLVGSDGLDAAHLGGQIGPGAGDP